MLNFVKRAALYIRVSSEEQARHGLSLGEQRADLLRYAESHGYAVASVYADEGVSARKPMRVRKELQRLLSDVKQKKIDIIVIKCLDRWFRNIADYHKVQEILDEYGVNWECSQDRYDTTTAAGRLNLNLRLAIAQDEADRTSERIKYVFQGKRERREVLGGKKPFGYKIEEKHLIPDENAPIVRYMFQDICSGGTVTALPKKILNTFGIAVSRTLVYYTLRNRAYVGEMYGVPDYCPEIVDAAVFEKAQEILKPHIKTPRSGRVFLFSGLVKCPHCGRRLVACYSCKDKEGKRKYSYYRCFQAASAIVLNKCSFKRAVYESRIEKYLLANLQGFIAQHTLAVEESRAEMKKKTSGITFESINAKMTRLKDLYVDGLISKETYKADFEKLQKELSELSRSLDTMPAVAPALQAIASDEDFQTAYAALPQEGKKEFWRSIIKSIEFDDTPDTHGRGKITPFRVIFL